MTIAGQIEDHAELRGLVAAGLPAFAWRPRDGAIVWANAGGLALWGVADIDVLASRALDRSMPAVARLQRLALVLAPGAEDEQEFVFWLPSGSRSMTCRCAKLRAGDDDVLLLQLAPAHGEKAAPAIAFNGHAAQIAARVAPPLAPQDAATLAEIARLIRQRSDGSGAGIAPPAEPPAAQSAPERAQGSTEVLARLSHELRTPLNAIIGYGELLQSEQQGPLGSPKYRAYAGDMLAAARHCLSIVNDLFDMTRLAAGEHKPEFSEVDVNEAVRACLGILLPIAHKAGVALSDDLASGLPLAILDRRGLRQILLNVIGNAIKFTPRGGLVTIASRYQLGVGLQVVVADTGAGMTSGNLEAARGQPHGGMIGAGLGLPISRALASANGGTLRVESTPSRGTEVILFLPMTRLLLR